MRRALAAVGVVMCIALGAAGPAWGDFYPARELAKHAREFEKMIQNDFKGNNWQPVHAGSFMGYVAGASDALADQLEFDEEVDVTQVCSVVAKYLRDHPESWNKPAGAVCRAALVEAFGRADVAEPKKE